MSTVMQSNVSRAVRFHSARRRFVRHLPVPLNRVSFNCIKNVLRNPNDTDGERAIHSFPVSASAMVLPISIFSATSESRNLAEKTQLFLLFNCKIVSDFEILEFGFIEHDSGLA